MPTTPQPCIVFCTTCRGRVQHLKKTLPKNIEYNRDYDNCKFVILDYNSPDGLIPYLWETYPDLIESGRLCVYSYPKATSFHMSHAKNMAHRLGVVEGADILINMDADNYGGPGFATWIAEQYRSTHNVNGFFLWTNARSVSGRARQGLGGRIGMSRNLFFKTGGYDEYYKDWSPEDEDLKARIRRLGYQGVGIPIEYLFVIPHTDGLRFREYPHAKPTPEKEQAAKEGIWAAEHTIANYGNYGCGWAQKILRGPKGELYQDIVDLDPLPTRIFGVGMQKTATTSLSGALTILGYDSAHWTTPRWSRDIWEEMMNQGRSITLERHYALSDIPIPILYKELDMAYPGSKFILTLRDENKWVNSVRNHWDPKYNPFRDTWNEDAFSHKAHQLQYGRRSFDAEVFLNCYRRHNAEVLEYFRCRPNDLLVLDMESAGWPALCNFFHDAIPVRPYPRAFVTQAH